MNRLVSDLLRGLGLLPPEISKTPQVIPTGVSSLDELLGIGGFPRGRLSAITGAPASGRAALALGMAARAQRRGGSAAILDLDGALSPSVVASFGLSRDATLMARPSCGEDALRLAQALARSAAVEVLILDSVASLVPRSQLVGPLEGLRPPLAPALRRGLRELARWVHRRDVVALLIDQGWGSRRSLGAPYAALGVELRLMEGAEGDQESHRKGVSVEVFKNAWGPAGEGVVVDVRLGSGLP